MIYYVEYGCSQETVSEVVDASSLEAVENWAKLQAEESYYSYDCNYFDPDEYPDMTEEEFAEIQQEDMVMDTFYSVCEYDEENEDHRLALEEQDNKPYEI